MDAAVLGFLEAHWRAPAEPMGRPLVATEYLRQYLGVVRGDQRLIYVNGFSSYHYRGRVLEYRQNPSTIPNGVSSAESFWQVEPVIVADGGWDYFGCWYDPKTGEFSGLQFNNESPAR
ncbi:MAG TPA: hypothetical protein VFV19_12590 [Candidatus Polarisedimenticolaceae bacterium]|nr:hypothetical protein [Candidatus Polarisedimenticolaceae bacterium]